MGDILGIIVVAVIMIFLSIIPVAMFNVIFTWFMKLELKFFAGFKRESKPIGKHVQKKQVVHSASTASINKDLPSDSLIKKETKRTKLLQDDDDSLHGIS